MYRFSHSITVQHIIATAFYRDISMRYEYIPILLGLSIGHSLAQTRDEKSVIIVSNTAGIPVSAIAPAPTPVLKPKPTAVLLQTSTPRPPLTGVKPTAAPTRAPAVIANEPPKVSKKPVQTDVKQEKLPEVLPLTTPPANASVLQQAALPKQTTPQLVTGFITKNGNIYEVTDENGIGLIESRQIPETDANPHICNYGTVVLYSDLPCNEVSDVVRIGEIHHKVVNPVVPQQKPQEPQPSSDVSQLAAANNNATENVANSVANKNDDFADFDEFQPKPVKKRQRGNTNSNNKRKRNGNKNRPNAVRQGDGNKRRQQAQQQQRRRLSNNKTKQQRKRLQQQQQVKRRDQNDYFNGQRRRGQNSNKRRNSAYNDYDYYNWRL